MGQWDSDVMFVSPTSVPYDLIIPRHIFQGERKEKLKRIQNLLNHEPSMSMNFNLRG